MLVLDLLIAPFALIVLLTRVNTTRNEWTCLHIRPGSTTTWKLLQRLSSFLPDKTSSIKKTFSTMLQFVGLPLQRIKTLHSLGLTLKMHFSINKLISDTWDYSNEISQLQTLLLLTIVAYMLRQWNQWAFKLISPKFHLIIWETSMGLWLIWLHGLFHYINLIREPPRLDLNITFPLEHVTELLVLGEWMLSVAVDKFGIVGKISKMDFVSLRQKLMVIPLLKYRYRGSLHSDYVPTLDKDIFAITNTQPNMKQGEPWIMFASSRHKMFFCWISPTTQIFQVDDTRATTNPHQCLRFLHEKCNFSFLQIPKKNLMEFTTLRYFQSKVITCNILNSSK